MTAKRASPALPRDVLPGYRLDPASIAMNREYDLYRGVRVEDGARVIAITPTGDEPSVASVGRMETSFRLRHLLSDEWAIAPIEMQWIGQRPMQISRDPAGLVLAYSNTLDLDPERRIRIAIAVAAAVRCVHDAGIIHRDLSPAFFMVAEDAGRAWLGGFGHALLRPSREPVTMPVGTPAYMAPEQTGRTHRGLDRRADLYALGVMIFEILTGALPFTSVDANELMHCHIARRPPSLRSRAPWIPPALEAIVTKLLEKNPAARYQSAVGVEHDLRACLAQWRVEGADGDVASLSLASRDVPLPATAAVASGAPAELTIVSTTTAEGLPLEISAFLDVSDALSGELELEVLVGRLLRIVLEQSGGERALLVSRDLTTVRARASVADDGTVVDTIPVPLASSDAALSVLRRAAETRSLVRIDDAAVPDGRWPDPYLSSTAQRSVLCVPLVHRGRLDGLLYVENRLISHAFGERRAAFLRLLAAHAASALATATLYADLDGSDARYRFLFENVPVAILQLDTRGYQTLFDEMRARGEDVEDFVRNAPDFIERIGPSMIGRVANTACARLFGVETTAELLRPIGFLWRDQPNALRRSVLARMAGQKGYVERSNVRTFDGRIIDVLFVIAYRQENESAAPLDIVSFIDLGDLVAAERMLERMQAEFAHAARVSMLGELSASLAHEINQPLMAILADNLAERRWLARATPNVEEALVANARIGAEATRAADIVSRTRLMAVNTAPQRVPTEINEIVKEATQFLHYEVRSRGVTLTLDLAPGLPNVHADRVQLQQVIVNLAVNAIQAMGRTPLGEQRVVIRSRAEGAFVRVQVEDSGPGFPPADADRLFEGFFSTRTDGMGMGLRICRSLVEAHNGTIEGRNLPDGGAVFSFTLPV